MAEQYEEVQNPLREEERFATKDAMKGVEERRQAAADALAETPKAQLEETRKALEAQAEEQSAALEQRAERRKADTKAEVPQTRQATSEDAQKGAGSDSGSKGSKSSSDK